MIAFDYRYFMINYRIVSGTVNYSAIGISELKISRYKTFRCRQLKTEHKYIP